MQYWICVENTIKLSKFDTFENGRNRFKVSIQLLNDYVLSPMPLDGSNSDINITIILSVHFAMNVNMEDGSALMLQSPIMEA